MEECRKKNYILIFAVLTVLFILLFFLNLTQGSVDISTADIMNAISGKERDSLNGSIIWKIRLPRLFSTIILGAALSLAGFLLQIIFSNPIAGPYILGISSSAKLAVSFAMIGAAGSGIFFSSTMYVIVAFAGSMAAMGFVILISGKVKSPSALIISGVMIGYICTAVTDFVVTFAEDADIVNLQNWSRGSFSGMNWSQVTVQAAVAIPTCLIVFLISKPIGAYQIGESYAANMGINLKAFRMLLIVLSSILSACVTAFAGPVSFIGIAVPHVARIVLKTSKPIVVIPVCILGGSVFCMGCDFIARYAFSPTELGISSVTAVFGAPVVIAAMIRKKK